MVTKHYGRKENIVQARYLSIGVFAEIVDPAEYLGCIVTKTGDEILVCVHGNETTASAFHATWHIDEYQNYKVRLLGNDETIVLQNDLG